MKSFELESLLKVSETSSHRVQGRKKERLTVCSWGCFHCLGWDHQSAATPTGAKSVDYTGTAQLGQHPCTHPPDQVPVPQTQLSHSPHCHQGGTRLCLWPPQNTPGLRTAHMTCCLTPQTVSPTLHPVFKWFPWEGSHQKQISLKYKPRHFRKWITDLNVKSKLQNS